MVLPNTYLCRAETRGGERGEKQEVREVVGGGTVQTYQPLCTTKMGGLSYSALTQ